MSEGKEPGVPAKVWAVIRKDLGLKIMALLFAIILWVFVLQGTNPNREKTVPNIPVQFIGLDELQKNGLTVRVSQTPLTQQVQATVEVRKTSFDALNSQKIDALVDLSKVKTPGVQQLAVEASSSLGSILSVSPREVRLEIDRISETKIPLSLNLVGTLPQGYWMGKPYCSVNSITLRGAQTDVALVSRAVCDIQVGTLASNVTRYVTVQTSAQVRLLDAKGDEINSAYFDAHMPFVTASIDVSPMRTISISTADAIQGTVAKGYEIKSAPQVVPTSVSILGDYALINSLPSLSIEKIDVEGAKAPINTKVKLILPKDVALTGANEVEVRIDIGEQLGERIFTKQPVTVTGQAEGMKASLSASSVDVRVRAPLSQLSWIKASSIQPYVDITGLPTGKYTVQLLFKLPTGLTPDNVTANITEVEVTIE